MVARPVSLGRRDSGTTPAPKIKQAVKMVDENAVFCDSISEFMTDNQDFLVVGVCGLQVRKKEMLLTGKQIIHSCHGLSLLMFCSLERGEEHLDQRVGTSESCCRW